jgi:hypothetical protein
MTQDFSGGGSHISIAMPDGTTCNAFIQFQVYSNDEGGKIVRFSSGELLRLYEAIEAHCKGHGVRSIESPYLPEAIELRETLTDLPHSPQRTQLPHLDLSALRVY